MVVVRGEIYWCASDPIQGHEQGAVRRVVVVSSNAYNQTRSPLVAIVPLTRAVAKTPMHLALAPEETGLESPSTALIDHARFLDRSRLRDGPIGMLNEASLAR